MADFTEQTAVPTTTWTDVPGISSTTWANASKDPKKRYGVGRYGVGVYGQGYLAGSTPNFAEIANHG